MAITVKQALEIGGLQKGRVLAGSQHLDRVIHHVNILEAPWESFWDSQGHLFLTSFYALRNNTPLQIKNVQRLAENGCAALVFQKGVQDILDPLVIQQAEESGLPLIEVEEAISYPEIITPLVQAISREKTFLLQRSQEIHRRLTGLILSGDGLPAVVAVLHELIERPVAIINRWGDVLASMSFENSDQPQMDEDDLLQEMARSERLGLTWHKASGRWLAPLLAGEQGEIDGFVLVWDTQQEANPLDLTAIEQAATETFTVSLASRLENGEERREYLWQGQPIDLLQHLACLPNVEKKSFAAAAGPLPLTALEKEGNTSPVSHALQVGQALLSVNDNGGKAAIVALQAILPGQFSTFATVTEINWYGQGQETYGRIKMLDIANRHLQLTYSQRYRQLTVDGRQRAAFPDLIITLGILGTPLTGEEVFMGQDLYLMVVPQTVA